jgi:P-type conjugative transfer protein TrbG
MRRRERFLWLVFAGTVVLTPGWRGGRLLAQEPGRESSAAGSWVAGAPGIPGGGAAAAASPALPAAPRAAGAPAAATAPEVTAVEAAAVTPSFALAAAEVSAAGALPAADRGAMATGGAGTAMVAPSGATPPGASPAGASPAANAAVVVPPATAAAGQTPVAAAPAAAAGGAGAGAAPVPAALPAAEPLGAQDGEGGDGLTPEVRRESAAAAAGREPAVLQHGDDLQVPFGRQVPVLRCAPLRVCLIELEEDELPLDTMLGDSTRWMVVRAVAGPRGATPVIAVKPTECNVTTNLVITTNRRIYQVTLEARSCKGEEAGNPSEPYTHLLRFYYPEDFLRHLTSAAEARRQAAAADARSLLPLAATGPADLNFDYRWAKKGRFPWEPAAVFDDRVHTYVRLPGGGAGQESPVLFELDAKGGLAMVNYAVHGRTLVADRVLDRAVLVLGAGRGEARLEITRGGH